MGGGSVEGAEKAEEAVRKQVPEKRICFGRQFSRILQLAQEEKSCKLGKIDCVCLWSVYSEKRKSAATRDPVGSGG